MQHTNSEMGTSLITFVMHNKLALQKNTKGTKYDEIK